MHMLLKTHTQRSHISKRNVYGALILPRMILGSLWGAKHFIGKKPTTFIFLQQEFLIDIY